MVLGRIIPQVHVMVGQLSPLCQSGSWSYEHQSPVKVKHEEPYWLIEVILLHDISIAYLFTLLYICTHLFTHVYYIILYYTILYYIILFFSAVLYLQILDHVLSGGGPDDSDLSKRWHDPFRTANRLHHLRTSVGRVLCRGTIRNRRGSHVQRRLERSEVH